jgi:hypothetical protein
MRRPSPATIIALIALVVACGGVAVAAIPGPDGRIHACYGSDLVLRVAQHDLRCRDGQTRLVWNQQGVPGAKGAPGISKYKIVSAESKSTLTGEMTVKVDCPAGYDVLGGGASVHANSSKKWIVSSVPRRRKGSKPAGWRASARRGVTPLKGFMRAQAVCAIVSK